MKTQKVSNSNKILRSPSLMCKSCQKQMKLLISCHEHFRVYRFPREQADKQTKLLVFPAEKINLNVGRVTK